MTIMIPMIPINPMLFPHKSPKEPRASPTKPIHQRKLTALDELMKLIPSCFGFRRGGTAQSRTKHSRQRKNPRKHGRKQPFVRKFRGSNSGGHGTRTRSPLRGTSVPMRPLTNSLILRLQLNLKKPNRLVETETALSQLRSADEFNEFLVALKPA